MDSHQNISLETVENDLGADISVPALNIKFADGSNARVTYAYQIALDPMSAPEVISKYGDQESALNDLSKAVEGAVFAVLETKTQNEVRKNRVNLGQQILELTKSAQDRTGHRIEEFSIQEIE